MDDRIFQTNLMNVAQEKGFYDLAELSESDLRFVYSIVERNSDENIRRMNKEFVDMYCMPSKIVNTLRHGQNYDPDLEAMFYKFKSKAHESIHTTIEHNSIDLLNMLQSGDLSFLDNDDMSYAFLYFIAIQYFRTKKMKENFVLSFGAAVAKFKTDHGIVSDSVWKVLSHVFASNVAMSLFAIRQNYKLIKINNATEISFLVSDQPIVNVAKVGKHMYEPVDRLEWYFPVAPKLAYLYSNNDIIEARTIDVSSDDDVDAYNKVIIMNSNQQIYGDSEDILERCCGV